MNEFWTGKDLANLVDRRKMTKMTHAVRGQEIKWEISGDIDKH